MDFGNSCALICRFILLILLLYSIILSCMVVSSCHFISAITPNEITHGVGLQTFENEAGLCEPHNSFVVKNYNGMEMAAKVGGYVAPTCGVLVFLWLLVECCKADGCFGGKCIPSILLLGAVVCQGITFLLFQSDLFCSNKDITECALGDAGFRSVQACLVYSFCCILYYCAPTPVPFSPPQNLAKVTRVEMAPVSNDKGEKKEKRSKKDEPPETGVQTREMYEERRRGKKVNSRGVSGRSKDKLLNDPNVNRDKLKSQERGRSVSKKSDKHPEDTITVYDHNKNKKKGRRGSSQEKFDEYVDTEPDGMDWSAYSPEPREAYLSKKREKKKKEKKADRHKDHHRDSRSSRSPRDEDSRGHDDSYYSVISKDGTSRYEDDRKHGNKHGNSHGNSYYSERDGSYDDSGRGDYSNYDQSPGSGRDSGRVDYSNYDRSPGSGRDSRDHRGQDDYSYAQDDYSYAQSYAQSYVQDRHGDPPEHEDSYRKSSRSSSGHGRSKSRDQRSYNDSYDDSYSYDDRSRGYRDDPSFV